MKTLSIDGINLIGYFGRGFGVGESSRLMFETLKSANIPLSLISANDLLEGVKEEVFSHPIDNEFKYAINLFAIDVAHITLFILKHGWKVFESRYNIGIFFWETTQSTPQVLEGWECMDEIWTTSHYMQKNLSKMTPVPVYYIPQPLEPPKNMLPINKNFVQLPDRFTFLFFFSFKSILERKNPQALIDAFQHAFPSQTDVQLVIKSKDSQDYMMDLNRLIRGCEDDSRIIWIDKTMNADERFQLMNCCDCYVSLHRSEGFGLTLSEAMLLEKPVIGTAYSGNMDFMNQENSYLCSYHLIPIGEGYSPYPSTGQWAQPLVHDAARLMKRIFDNPQEAKMKAIKGKEFILQHHSLEKVGEEILKRLKEVPIKKSICRPYYYLRNRSLIEIKEKIKKIRKFLRPIKRVYKYLRNES